VLFEDRMFTNVRESDSILWVKMKHFFEKILNIRCTVLEKLLFRSLNKGRIAEILSDLFKLNLFSLGLPMRIKFYVIKAVLKGNSMLSMK